MYIISEGNFLIISKDSQVFSEPRHFW